MHEASIAQGIFHGALHALPPGKHIVRIKVIAGAQMAIVYDSLELYFRELSRGTPAEGAIIELNRLLPRLICKACGIVEEHHRGTPISTTCTKCGGGNRLEAGRELYLESMEVTDEEGDEDGEEGEGDGAEKNG
ncbi:MAG: hydrogenase maturation nickel metallochaperone HypA [Candidatus Ozemobacteraceae bacterium]